MSEVVSGVPQVTHGVFKEDGLFGRACSTGPASGGLALVLGGLAAVALRRRRGLLAAGLAVLVASPAQAGEDRIKGHLDADGDFRTDHSFVVSGGGMVMDDAGWAGVYSSRLPVIQLQSGFQFFRLLEVDGTIGMVRRRGNAVDDAGETSSDEAALTMLPVSVSADLRLDLFDGQPLVPFGTIGGDFWLYRERTGAIDFENILSERPTSTSDARYGWHYGAGAELLLDWMDPRHASRAWARYGIHDTYLVGTWTRQAMLSGETDISLDADAFTFGIKVDFE